MEVLRSVRALQFVTTGGHCQSMKSDGILTLVCKLKLTMFLIVTVVLCSAATIGSNGSLHPDNVSSLGLAPRHLASGELLRVMTSVVLTHDARHLIAAVVMIFLAVGWCERTLGSKIVMWTFCLSHLTSVLVFAVGVGMLHWMQLGQTFSTLYSLHDVGPSAGYYGCLSRTILASNLQNQRIWTIGLFALLGVRTFVSFLQMPSSQITFSADLVHLIAASVGIVLQSLSHQAKVDYAAIA